MAVNGTYNIEIETPMGNRPSTLTLEPEGKTLSGYNSDEMGTQTFEDGTVNGNDFSFSLIMTSAVGDLNLTYTGTVNGDTVSGQVQAGTVEAFPFKGKRVKE